MALAVAAALALTPGTLTPGPSPASGRGEHAIGRRIYREGVLASGRPLRGELAGGVVLKGAAASCASCHRRSGFGGVEGTVHVPPVTGAALFAPAGPDRDTLFAPLFQDDLSLPSRARLLTFPERPAYTRETLAAALREGHDPAGRSFDAPMPRYRLSDGDLDHLLAYLRTLGAGPAPGVEENALHVATVFTPGADPDRRQAVLDVFEAWVRWKNAEIDRRRQRPDAVPTDEDLRFADRPWHLHVWEPRGQPETWTRQLLEWEAERPVFAVLGGLGGLGADTETWAPIHAFCERREIPCLFPQTDLPVTASAGATTLYLSGGLVQEAEALALHLRQTVPDLAGHRIVQVVRDAAGREAAEALERALGPHPPSPSPVALPPPGRGGAATRIHTSGGRGFPTPRIQELGESGSPPLPGEGRATGEGGQGGEVLVLWLGPADLAALGDLHGFERIFLSTSLLGETVPPLPAAWRDRAVLLHRRAFPGGELPQAFRIRAWLRTRGVARRHEALQLDAWFTLALADEAISRLAGRFSRDLFVETVERETERMPDPGVWPRLVLSPGRRIASRGCLLLRPDPSAPGGLAPASGWIVP